MTRTGSATVVLASGALAEVTAERIVYSAETAHLFERAQAYGVVAGDAALHPALADARATYNIEVEDLHTYVSEGLRVHDVSGIHGEIGNAVDGSVDALLGGRHGDGTVRDQVSDAATAPLHGVVAFVGRILDIYGDQVGRDVSGSDIAGAIGDGVNLGLGLLGGAVDFWVQRINAGSGWIEDRGNAARSKDTAHRVARHVPLTRDPRHRPVLKAGVTPRPRDRIHPRHLPLRSLRRSKQSDETRKGSEQGAATLPEGVSFVRQNTPNPCRRKRSLGPAVSTVLAKIGARAKTEDVECRRAGVIKIRNRRPTHFRLTRFHR